MILSSNSFNMGQIPWPNTLSLMITIAILCNDVHLSSAKFQISPTNNSIVSRLINTYNTSNLYCFGSNCSNTDGCRNESSDTSAIWQTKIRQEFREWVYRVKDQNTKGGFNRSVPVKVDMYAEVRSTIIVDKSGNADYATIQAAIDAVPLFNTRRITIFVSAGVYQYVEIFLGGAGSAVTKIVWHDTASTVDGRGSFIGTFQSASVAINAPNFIARGITFKNSASLNHQGVAPGQAVALQVSGDMTAFYDCHFIGCQDTLYDRQGRHYFRDCYIEGSIDFIFGDGRSLYKDCELHATGSGWLTAQKRQDPTENTGFSFVNCRVTGAGLFYLGRAWGPFSRVVFLFSFIENIITPSGWDDWGDPSRDRTVFYGQYRCSGPGANVKDRVAWSYALTEAEAEPFMDANFIDGHDWLPCL
ncbi:hypothetical protein O6H91_03G126700 [Diphasiastrum complanatum]|uniref:Uncharacterized protein n=1 Tax=Diphasiastrum complanatum TaxID=34168 RepID=A0ACC2EBE6_DIPCM|nr:hypothetical protein O6H91_03G126700 [Diphasiastrum complanatum]